MKKPRYVRIEPVGDGLWAHLWPLLVAFVSGWVIMMLEILGGRLLAPYFGYSVYQWGALIGVVMTALAAGYFVGGRVGDTPHALRVLAGALIVAGAYVFLVPLLGTSLLPPVRRLGPAWGAVVGSAVLLGVPSALLAMVSPIVVRLTMTSRIAETAGRVYAVSTLGSIAGTFFTAFYAIPVLGTRASHYVAGTLLVLATLALAITWRQRGYGLAAALLLLWLWPAPAPPPGTIYQAESLHNIIQVVDQPGARYLYLNYQDGPQTVMPKDSLLVGSYYDYFLLGPLINGGRRVLFLGAAGGTALKQLVTVYPLVDVVGVELDGKVIEAAQKFFGLAGEGRVRLVEQDARWYLESVRERYDVIDIDLYVTGHIPFFCTTREFFERARDRLTERGIIMMNVLSIQPGEDLIGPFVRTVQAVFPGVFLIGGSGNYILIASKAPLEDGAIRRTLETAPVPGPVREVANRALSTLRPATAGPEWPLFTDDRNDVEFRTFKMFYGEY